jgi:predicted ester cyclase
MKRTWIIVIVGLWLAATCTDGFEVKNIMVQNDKVAMWVDISGTHTGELFGIKPTHKKVKFREGRLGTK